MAGADYEEQSGELVFEQGVTKRQIQVEITDDGTYEKEEQVAAHTTHHSPVTTYYLLLTTHYLPLTAYHLLSTTYHSLLTTHYLPLTANPTDCLRTCVPAYLHTCYVAVPHRAHRGRGGRRLLARRQRGLRRAHPLRRRAP